MLLCFFLPNLVSCIILAMALVSKFTIFFPKARISTSTIRSKPKFCMQNQNYASTYLGNNLVNQNRAKLRFFLESVEESQWDKWMPSGLIYGISTNPLLFEREGIPYTTENLQLLANNAFALGAEEVHLQAWGEIVQDYIRTGLEISYMDPRIVVKLPITREGLRAATVLVQRGIRVAMTSLFSSHQVLLAASVGAEYASPYLGRINNLKKNGRKEIKEMNVILNGMDSSMRVLVSNINDVQQVVDLAIDGVTNFSLPPHVIVEMINQEDTVKASEEFEQAVQVTLQASEEEEEEEEEERAKVTLHKEK